MAVIGIILSVIGWILLAILILLLLVLFLPIGARILYTETWKVQVLLFGFIPILSFSGDQLPDKPKKEKPPAKPAAASSKEETPDNKPSDDKPSVVDEFKAFHKQEGIRGVIAFFKQLLGIVTGAFRRIARFITIRELVLSVRVGGDIADATAVRYGQICAALFPTLSALSYAIRFRRRSVCIRPDFTSDKLEVRLRAVIWVWPFGLVYAALVALAKFIMSWTKVTKASSDASANTQTDQKTA